MLVALGVHKNGQFTMFWCGAKADSDEGPSSEYACTAIIDTDLVQDYTMCARASESQRVGMDTSRGTVGESFQYSLFLLSFLLSFPSMLEQCMKLPCIPHQDFRTLDDEHVKGSFELRVMMEQVEHVEQALEIPLNEMSLQCLQHLHGIDEEFEPELCGDWGSSNRVLWYFFGPMNYKNTCGSQRYRESRLPHGSNSQIGHVRPRFGVRRNQLQTRQHREDLARGFR